MSQSLFQLKEFILHSGQQGHYKIECDALTDEDLETLAWMIAQKYTFHGVLGIPNGGVRLQKALEKYITPPPEGMLGTLLIVDDVLTTGGSMEEVKEELNYPYCQGVVIFARGKCPDWIDPIFQLWHQDV